LRTAARSLDVPANCNRPIRARSLLVAPLLFLALTVPAHAEPLFSAPFFPYGTGSSPRSVAIADLNADGRPDLVVANYNSNSVSVLLGIGDGKFGLKTDYGTGTGPSSVAIADLTRDGRPDLAVADSISNSVSVLLGPGDGTFALHVDYFTGSGPGSVAIADFNADGRPDLATANSTYSNVSVLLGNGDGTF